MDVIKQAYHSFFPYGEENKDSGAVAGRVVSPDSAMASANSQAGAEGSNQVVHNYRLFLGSIIDGKNYIPEILEYSRGLPVAQRGISIFVMNERYLNWLEEPSSDQSGAPSLKDQLLKEGVEVIPLGVIMDFLSKNYPSTTRLLHFIGSINLKLDADSMKINGNEAHDRLLSFILSMLLHDYAFSQANRSQSGDKKIVTVAYQNLLSCIFSPATIRTKETADILETVIFVNGTQKRYFFDGRELSRLIRPLAETANDRGKKPQFHPRLTFAPDVFSLSTSAADARSRAAVMEEIAYKFQMNPLFSTPLSETSRETLQANLKSLPFFIRANLNNELEGVCFAGNVEHGHEAINYDIRCEQNYPEFLRSFQLVLSRYFNNEYAIPRLKNLARKHNIQWRHSYFNSVDQTAGYASADNTTSGYQFTIDMPAISFYAKRREDLERFIGTMALDAETGRIKYLFPDPFRDFGFPSMPGVSGEGSSCQPLLNVSHLSTLSPLPSVEQEMSVYNQTINSYPAGGKYCFPTGQKTCSGSVSDQVQESTGTSAYQSLGTGLQYGVLAGILEGCGSHFKCPQLVHNPIFRGGYGFVTGGPLGAALGIGSHYLHRLPEAIRKGAQSGSWRSGCATILDGVLVLMPIATNGVYQFVGSGVGYLLGKYGTETTLNRLQPGETSKPDKPDADAPKAMKPVKMNRRSERKQLEAERGNKTGSTSSPLILLQEAIKNCTGADGKIPEQTDDSEIFRLVGKLLQEDNSLRMLDKECMKTLVDILPKSKPDITVKVMILYGNSLDSRNRSNYFHKKCKEYEQHYTGLAAAVSHCPELYLSCLKCHETGGIEKEWVDKLWDALPGSDNDKTLLEETAKKVIGCSSESDKKEACKKLLLDQKLSPDARLAIFNSQPINIQQELCEGDVLAKLGAEYLVRLENNPDGCKQKKGTTHIYKAIENWSAQQKPLSNNLIHLLIESNPQKYEKAAGRGIGDAAEWWEKRNKFGIKLKDRAGREIKFDDVTKRIRAKAVLLQLEADPSWKEG